MSQNPAKTLPPAGPRTRCLPAGDIDNLQLRKPAILEPWRATGPLLRVKVEWMWSDTGPIALKTVRRVKFRGDETLSVVGYDSVEFPHLPTNRRRREGDPYVTFSLLVKVIDAKSVPGYESSPARASKRFANVPAKPRRLFFLREHPHAN
jgi:hypothetical protein